MNKHVKRLAEEAGKLSAVERAELVDELLAGLSVCDAELDDVWRKEAKNRFTAWQRGEMKAVDADKVLARLKARSQ